MYFRISDFVKDWTCESESTLKLFNNLNDASLNKVVNEYFRTAGILAWYITTTISEMA